MCYTKVFQFDNIKYQIKLFIWAKVHITALIVMRNVLLHFLKQLLSAQMEKDIVSFIFKESWNTSQHNENWQHTDCTGKCGNHYPLSVRLATWFKWEKDCWQMCWSFESLETSQSELPTILIEDQNYQKFTESGNNVHLFVCFNAAVYSFSH